MNIAIIGRGDSLFETTRLLSKSHVVKLIVTAKEAPEYVKKTSDFDAISKELNAVFINTSKINSSEVIQKIKDIGHIDIAVSVNYVNAISETVINLFQLGILNAHGGDLPRYRGNACQAWAIINKEKKVGLCIHKMIGAELDSGDIITRDYFELSINTKISEIYTWMDLRIPELFRDALEVLTKDYSYVLEVQSKESKDILRCYPRRPEDGLIYWSSSAENILRLINASNKPYSGAYCFYNLKKLIIWDAELYEDNEKYLAISGQISQINKSSIIVICGDGKLKITLIEYENNIIKPSELISSIRSRLTS